MFGVTKEELLQGLENLRMRICSYSDPDHCDFDILPMDKSRGFTAIFW